jgi:hypothetical protein
MEVFGILNTPATPGSITQIVTKTDICAYFEDYTEKVEKSEAMHHLAMLSNEKRHRYAMIIVQVFPVLASAIIVPDLFGENYFWMVLCSVAFNLITSIVLGVMSVVDYEKIGESHRSVFLSCGELIRQVKYFLTFGDISQVQMSEFIDLCEHKYMSQIQFAPSIPASIEIEVNEAFSNKENREAIKEQSLQHRIKNWKRVQTHFASVSELSSLNMNELRSLLNDHPHNNYGKKRAKRIIDKKREVTKLELLESIVLECSITKSELTQHKVKRNKSASTSSQYDDQDVEAIAEATGIIPIPLPAKSQSQ